MALAQFAGLQGVAFAQAAAPAEADDARPTDEIVVTAQKRVQSINDVGITITALSQKDLERKGIASLADVASAIPTLQYSLSQNNTPIFTMRGVGFYESSLASYPAVSVSLDEVPLPFPALTTLTAFDLERIEALKGPQGTLFGQNTTGGAINYVAAKPTDAFALGGNVTYGRFNRVDANGFVSGPITDTLQGRLAVHYQHMDPSQVSLSRGDKNGRVEEYAMRAILAWEPTETLHVTINANGWRDKSDPLASQFIGVGTPQQAGFVLPALATLPRPDSARDADWSADHKPFANNRLYQLSGRVDFDVTDAVTLTSITAYTNYKTRADTDQDGTAYQIADVSQFGTIRSISQELRIANGSRDKLRWVVGGNFSKDHVYDRISLLSGDMSFGRRFGPFGSGTYTEQRMKNYAAFGNVEYDIGSMFTIKGGMRYTKAKRTADSCTRGEDGGLFSAFIANTSLTLRRNVLGDAGATLIPIPDRTCWQLNDLFVPSLAPVRTTLSEDNVSWRIGADFKPTQGMLLYTTVSKGYKAGSIPRSGATFIKQNQPVRQESVMAYEAGFKATLFDRMLQLNGAAFWYDYKNKQLRNRIVDPIIGLLEILTNIPKSRIRGAELSATLRPVDGLNLSLSGAYTDGKITKFTGVNFAGKVADFSGTVMPLAPKWEGTASVEYTFPGDKLRPFVGADLSARSHTFSIIGGQNVFFGGEQSFKLRGYSLLDLRAGIGAADGAWTATVFGKNVFNTYRWSNATALYDNLVRYAGTPATYGVTVSFRM
ncbi:TonB-dependent receptor [Rhizorhabdus wittichii]